MSYTQFIVAISPTWLYKPHIQPTMRWSSASGRDAAMPWCRPQPAYKTKGEEDDVNPIFR